MVDASGNLRGASACEQYSAVGVGNMIPGDRNFYLPSISPKIMTSLQTITRGAISLDLADVEATEAVEAGLNELINRRSASQEEANRTEELWKASERRVRERRQRENAQRWHDYYSTMARVHHGIAAEHAKRAEVVLEELAGEQGAA